MANKKTMRHASATKAKRQNIARRAPQFDIRNRVRTLTKAVLAAIREKKLDIAKTRFKEAQSEWQKAAKSNIFHRNAASRQISKMASQLAQLEKVH